MSSSSWGIPPAPRLLRLAAFSLDSMLAILLALGVRMLVRLGVVGQIGVWRAPDETALLDAQLVG
ncbi:MAG: hypothetical protein ACE5G2_03475, partial [Candidatus Krumholzibacteriia bacterium]